MNRKIILSLLFLLFFIPFARAEVIYVDKCEDITQSNVEVYLTRDINVTGLNYCFLLSGDNITFDCLGHEIIGKGKYYGYAGVYRGFSLKGFNITVRNCSLRDLKSVFFLHETRYARIENVKANNSHVFADPPADNGFADIVDCVFENGDMFIYYYGSYNPTIRVRNCSIINNTYGFYLGYYYGLPTSLVVDNVWLENNKYGIYYEYCCRNIVNVSNSYFVGNDYGIYFKSYDGCQNLYYNNYFDNKIENLHLPITDWIYYIKLELNIEKTEGTNIVGGPYLGGNYWSNYSEFCADEDKDWICDEPLVIFDSPWNRIADELPLTICVPNWELVSVERFCFNSSTVAINYTYHDLNGCYPDKSELELIDCGELVCREGECVRPGLTVEQRLFIIAVAILVSYLILKRGK